MSEQVTDIRFWADREKKIPDATIFWQKAERLSQVLANQGKSNRRTQIRRFYDEVLRLDQDAKRLPEEQWPSIQARLNLLVPKAVYAWGRDNLVSEEFVEFIKNSVKQIDNKEDLAMFATFFEAFMGFYRKEKKEQ
ncbi:MAG: type III-A CRISPR-associated protein Csm2 [Deltaproteobacteria bacterium]|nr:type III-A CRISPR-associated protein Csm2 [Deltaproteobacteria bacterium]